MSSFASSLGRVGVERRRLGLPLVLSLLGASGCWQHHECPAEERCNLADDDCDGQVDEGFVDADGAYRGVDHCGTCGVDCARAFPTAEEVACVDEPGVGPSCALVLCPDGFHRGGDGSCAPDVPVLCLPCSTDEDCSVRLPGARCLITGSGQARCGRGCDARAPCPAGFDCVSEQCVPQGGFCGCSEETADVELACLLSVDEAGLRCVGVQRCGEEGPGPCEPALTEACNAQDDDCDGAVDEDFRDEEGRYVSRLHCGECASPCVEPGPNMRADCLPAGADATCTVACLDGFVDVDGILANGCECERFDGDGPPPAVGGDSDCDGVPDDSDAFIYVAAIGSDTNPGTLARPMRTLNAGLARGQAVGRDVLVARGVYEGPLDVVGGVSIFGGYSPDFRDRDLELYPVILERRASAPGLPALRCVDVRTPTSIEGFTVSASDATGPGEGSTGIFLDGCGPEVALRSVTVLAGRGADGVSGRDSSARLGEWGFDSLDDLDGVSGGGGRTGTGGGESCRRVAGGAGGAKICRGVAVGGGAGGAAACPETGCFNGAPCGNAGCTDYTVDGVCDFDAVLRDAVPNPAPEAGRGPTPGLAGVLTYNAPTNRQVCNFCDDNPTLPRDSASGGDGAVGRDGEGGLGCSASEILDLAGRLGASSGGDGTEGENGSGGGGASAGAGYDVIGGTDPGCEDRAGGSGGGGGSGGCGAPGATGGGGGGTSVGIVVRLPRGLTTGPTFADVRIVTAGGGRGGDGGVAADGGLGGTGGVGGVSRFWCARTGGRGGDGGRGGAGGGGGGGCGGGSYGMYVFTGGRDAEEYRGSLLRSLVVELVGVPGRGGRGGFSPSSSGTDGVEGSVSSLQFVP